MEFAVVVVVVVDCGGVVVFAIPVPRKRPHMNVWPHSYCHPQQ